MDVLPPTPENIQHAVETIASGGVIAHATETCYGLACDLRNAEAVTKLFAIKKRDHSAPVSGLFSSLEHAQEYAVFSEEALRHAQEHLPGPVTIIVPLKDEANLYPTPESSKLQALSSKLTIGVRISPHPVAIDLVTRFGFPLSTTSTNIHGMPSTYSVEEIVEQFDGASLTPDLILDSGVLPKNPPSTVVVFTEKGQETLRE